MAIAAIIVGAAGAVISFIIPFPVGHFLGPPIGVIFGVVSLVLAAVAPRAKKKLKIIGLIVAASVLAISAARIVSLFTCMGRIGGILGALSA